MSEKDIITLAGHFFLLKIGRGFLKSIDFKTKNEYSLKLLCVSFS